VSVLDNRQIFLEGLTVPCSSKWTKDNHALVEWASKFFTIPPYAEELNNIGTQLCNIKAKSAFR